MHEVQGQSKGHVVGVRLVRHKDPLYDDERYCLVMATRSKMHFEYLAVDDEDELSLRMKSTDFSRGEGPATPNETGSSQLPGSDTSRTRSRGDLRVEKFSQKEHAMARLHRPHAWISTGNAVPSHRLQVQK